ncbi:MAG TPA: alginate lyase family protein [Steroidobacteraceae bacterium]
MNRLRAMGTREVSYRGLQFMQAQLQRVGLGRTAMIPAGTARGRPWVGTLPQEFPVATYRAAAEQILSGHFRLFGHRDCQLGFPPEWNRDPESGTRAPLAFGKTLNYRDPRIVGNIKYLWETNRHLELVTLAQAWRLTGELRFAHACRELLDSWLRDCPYLLGPNWSSSLELALRLVNWSCAWHLLEGDACILFRDSAGLAFKDRWLNAVRQHCHFVAGHMSLYSSANNHLLGELLGLLVAATTWPCWRESRSWQQQSRARFEEQALLQNGADGVNKEQAIWYQHEVADMMLLAGLSAAHNGCGFGKEFWSRLEAMLTFIASCMDAGGQVPAIGDADDAVLVRFCPASDLCVYRSLLASGAVLFERADFKYKAGVFDDKSRWLLGDAAAAKFAALPQQAAPPRRAFEPGGYYILGSDFHAAREVRITVDAAPLGYLAIAAHGHADALSCTLSAAGQQLLIDPGTYCYHTQRRWRDYFRGTSAHNTVRVDGQDQSSSGGSFLWNQHAHARCLLSEFHADYQRVVCEHDGYRRLHDPVVHRREISYRRPEGRITVSDCVVCAATHYIEIFWHFAEECVLSLRDDVAVATSGMLALTVRWPRELRAELVRGREDPPLGWNSRRFGEKLPTNCLVACGSVGANWQGTTTLDLSWDGAAW